MSGNGWRGWSIGSGRKGFADALPAAARYCTDGGSVYSVVAWPGAGVHVLSVNKDETYTIEGINADLRTYLGRLKRRSRCFSRSIEKLQEAVLYSALRNGLMGAFGEALTAVG